MIKNNNLSIIWDILPTARLVGGCVRDMLLNIEPNDYDFATTCLPEEIINIFTEKGFQVIPTGLQHGTVTVVLNGENYEITTLRTDDETDGRRATVSFTDDWEKDSNRRDFTFNALYMDSSGKIYDYHGGEEDLKNNMIRFIGNAEDRIKEDTLRILRYYRFMTKLPTFGGYTKDIEDIIKNKSLIKNLSIERVYSELVKIFNSENKWKVIELLNKHGISDIIFNKEITIPKTEISDCSYLDIFSYMADKKDYMKQFKTTVSDIRHVNNVLSLDDKLDEEISEYEIKKLLLDYSHDEIISSIIKNTIDKKFYNWKQVEHKIKNTTKPIFPVKGQDIINFGFQGGEIIGKKLKLLKTIWIENHFKDDKYTLLHYLRNVMISTKVDILYKHEIIENNNHILLTEGNLSKLGIVILKNQINYIDNMNMNRHDSIPISNIKTGFRTYKYYTYELNDNSILKNIKYTLYYEYMLSMTVEGRTYGSCSEDNPFINMESFFDEKEYSTVPYVIKKAISDNITKRKIYIILENKNDLAKIKLKI